MSWAGLANNQTISFNNLQDAVTNSPNFIAKQAIPVSLEQITKTDANDYVFIDTAYSPYAAKASNQLVVKTDLVKVGCIDIAIDATYANVFEMTMRVTISGGTLPAALTIEFDWCTDSGASGTASFPLPSGFSGTTDVFVNLSAVATYTGTYGSVDVVVADGDTVTELWVKGATINITTSDTTRPYCGTFTNVDNACTGASGETGVCLFNCFPIFS